MLMTPDMSQAKSKSSCGRCVRHSLHLQQHTKGLKGSWNTTNNRFHPNTGAHSKLDVQSMPIHNQRRSRSAACQCCVRCPLSHKPMHNDSSTSVSVQVVHYCQCVDNSGMSTPVTTHVCIVIHQYMSVNTSHKSLHMHHCRSFSSNLNTLCLASSAACALPCPTLDTLRAPHSCHMIRIHRTFNTPICPRIHHSTGSAHHTRHDSWIKRLSRSTLRS
jgi:hypothetical protein